MKANSVIFWKVEEKKENESNVNLRYLIRMAKIVEYHGNLSKRELSLEIIDEMINKSEEEYMAIKKQAWECRESFILTEQAEGTNKTKLKEIRKRDEMSNQWRIWKIVSGNKMGTAVIAVKVPRAGGKVIINERNEVERKIMICLSKRFSLTNDNLIMEQECTSKIGYFAEKEDAEDILKGIIPQTL